ncbi:winged helix-turn-helix domain-containing protein [Natrialbaceae archaeon AArc-T1-2]|uniref:winged helix-turn-helix domain-containing protein n=1 Tax=Natrialbaceae archaeon AArc-T1-2 TaxID=3053904 RepID=UPI00255B3136|nr:helix-turn-helix domain-containing protein [Natrialbaceae archaeon AArc-T1-2]WIV68362.1 helix-turn-helix domain-containing protein [Natrialbaceae archaeon AArc-T1-2]
MVVLRSTRDDETVDPRAVLEALEDETCQSIVEALDEPRTAPELASICDVSTSTLYRKLDLLVDASLVRSAVKIRDDGHHTLRYSRDFETVIVAADERDGLAVEIERPSPFGPFYGRQTGDRDRDRG